MAFQPSRFVRHTNAYNSGQITTTFNPDVGDVIENGPAIFSYASAVDTVAQIAAANYFASVVYDLAINDQILVVGSDATEYLQVATVDRDAGTVTTVSAFPTGVIGTANISNLAVTTAKLADGSVTSVKLAAGSVLSANLSPLALQYVAVPVSASAFNGAYATPVLLVAAGGANTLLVLDKCDLLETYNSAAYAAGGTVAVQYDSTANGAGVIASSTLANTAFQVTASTGFVMNGGVVPQTFSTCVNKGLYLSNIGAAFTTGNSAMVAHVWYKVIPTV